MNQTKQWPSWSLLGGMPYTDSANTDIRITIRREQERLDRERRQQERREAEDRDHDQG